MAFQDIVTDVERAGEAIRNTTSLLKALGEESQRLAPGDSQILTPTPPPPAPAVSGTGSSGASPFKEGNHRTGLEPFDASGADAGAAVSGSSGEPSGEGNRVGLERFQGDLRRLARQLTGVVEAGQQDLLRRLDQLQRENRDLRRRLDAALRQQGSSPAGDGVAPSVAADSTLLL
jgi:hypothetical protein